MGSGRNQNAIKRGPKQLPTVDCISVPARKRQCAPNWGFARKEEEQAVEEEEEDEEEGGGGRRKEERRGGGSGRKEVFHLFLAVMSRQ
jgi:hypothetical protein